MINHQPHKTLRLRIYFVSRLSLITVIFYLLALVSSPAFAVAGSGVIRQVDDAASSAPAIGDDPILRVILTRFRGVHELTISSNSTLHILRNHPGDNVNSETSVDPTNSEYINAPESQNTDDPSQKIVTATNSNSIVLTIGETVKIAPLDDQSGTATGIGLLSSGSNVRHYRGEIDITAQPDGTLRVVDVIGVEEYLLGVVGPEIGSGAPIEAIKAQAVAARTYALKNRGKYAKLNADIDDSTACQSYGGIESESKNGSASVKDTTGQVVAYNGALIDALYATDCGGETADGGLPYLSPVSDPECTQSSSWTLSIPITSFLASFSTIHGLTVPPGIDQISILKSDVSGRVLELQLSNSVSGQVCYVTSNQLRVALGVDKLRSTLFTVSLDKTNENCVFNGRGWGHGLGMCQHGAVNLAKAGATYQEILAHYYSGTQLAQVDHSMLVAAAPVMKVDIRTISSSMPVDLKPAQVVKPKVIPDYGPSLMLRPKPSDSNFVLPTWPPHDL